MKDKGVAINTSTPVKDLTSAQITAIILHGLNKYFLSKRQKRHWVVFPELRLGSGFGKVSKRRVDYFVIHSGRGNETIAFEIKASRSDFKRDIEDDLKQRGARLYANKFYYVAPKGLLKSQEIPLWAGLVEYDIERNRRCPKHAHFDIIVPAPPQPKANPSWNLICSIVRKVKRLNGLEDED